MIQQLFKGDIYHCQFCHKDYRYRGEVTGCGQQCCHGADEPLTPDEVWKEHKRREKAILGTHKWKLKIKK